jgi:hypothetical protein
VRRKGEVKRLNGHNWDGLNAHEML